MYRGRGRHYDSGKNDQFFTLIKLAAQLWQIHSTNLLDIIFGARVLDTFVLLTIDANSNFMSAKCHSNKKCRARFVGLPILRKCLNVIFAGRAFLKVVRPTTVRHESDFDSTWNHIFNFRVLRYLSAVHGKRFRIGTTTMVRLWRISEIYYDRGCLPDRWRLYINYSQQRWATAESRWKLHGVWCGYIYIYEDNIKCYRVY